MTISFLKKYGYPFFEYFYNHIVANEAEEQVQNVERFKEEFIILGLRVLTDYDKLFPLLEPRFGVMNTSNFMRFFFRLYWAQNSCVSFRNFKNLQDHYQAALTNLPATRVAGYTLGLQALIYNTNFLVSNSFAAQIMDTLIPENIEYSNLTVYEKVGSFLTSVIATGNFYVPNAKREPISLFPSITDKVIHFMNHLKTQNKVT
jgi:hypothetical protein